MTIRFITFVSSPEPAHLANAAVCFSTGPLAGLVLSGFALYDVGAMFPLVTFPPNLHQPGAAALRDLILDAWTTSTPSFDGTPETFHVAATDAAESDRS